MNGGVAHAYARHISPNSVSFCGVFAPGDADVHPDQNREHRQRHESRPLKQESDHDDEESDVLRMADSGVNARGRQAMFPMRGAEGVPGDSGHERHDAKIGAPS